MEITSSDLQPVSMNGSTGLTEKFAGAVDWKEFKERTMAQVMKCFAGKAPPDYFLADLVVSFWMNHFDKSPEEIEEVLRSTPLPNNTEDSDAGLISVIDTSDEYSTLESAPLLDNIDSRSYKDALLTGLVEDGESCTVSDGSEEA